jgi:hypothetical protein
MTRRGKVPEGHQLLAIRRVWAKRWGPLGGTTRSL